MRASNVTTLKPASPDHGETNPAWRRYATRVAAGRGRVSELTDMVIVRANGTTLEGWDRGGRFVQVRNVTGTVPLDEGGASAADLQRAAAARAIVGPAVRAECPECGRTIGLRSDGSFGAHGRLEDRDARCPGSGAFFEPAVGR